jgi:hypothetical protein
MGMRSQPRGPAPGAADALGSSFDMLSRLRAGRRSGDAIRPRTEHGVPAHASPYAPARRAHLHVSGFDPRAAGGRQAIRLELRGMPADVPALTLLLQSDLLPAGGARQTLSRSLDGAWRPLVVEFSSRGREHGQYRIDVELHARTAGQRGAARSWVATLLLLVPRADASLARSTRPSCRPTRTCASAPTTARSRACAGSKRPGRWTSTSRRATPGSRGWTSTPRQGRRAARSRSACSTMAWDEDLIEIDQPAARAHPAPASSACLVHAEPEAGGQRHMRLFALEECLLGRFDACADAADLLLQHYGEAGPVHDGLTRRCRAVMP